MSHAKRYTDKGVANKGWAPKTSNRAATGCLEGGCARSAHRKPLMERSAEPFADDGESAQDKRRQGGERK